MGRGWILSSRCISDSSKFFATRRFALLFIDGLFSSYCWLLAPILEATACFGHCEKCISFLDLPGKDARGKRRYSGEMWFCQCSH